jgi:hypothetical protein
MISGHERDKESLPSQSSALLQAEHVTVKLSSEAAVNFCHEVRTSDNCVVCFMGYNQLAK